ncbi:hypothetical protein A3758_13685 [Oleiphilus sp. HI0118]|uniref:hypothetical protein n=1 Tax=unclassified Oleiphilus TaxID=2631174 RepID=UPI0007C3B70E|nr:MULTISPECIES: hypothetical protein [unclassified Oleiphilus]KZY91946.1 hypothetical protein A3744_03665 [Oleiphilus sp. HI0073]KZZ13764.1 hypothetical protein A3750_02850 [Oleiphilus sp. HI0079]KZZ41579.1 hypothetical protein A3758_22700 [Oleiphilus sp. HI0118]KZZ49896.1 hypothetical protein A3758_13685 [Oleiphilus sp. HI0118]
MSRLANCEATRIEIREKALRNALERNTYGTRARFAASDTESVLVEDAASMSPELFDRLVTKSVSLIN